MAYEDPNAPSQASAPTTAPATTPEKSPVHGIGFGHPFWQSLSSRCSVSSADWLPSAVITGSSQNWGHGVQLQRPASLVLLLPSGSWQ